MLAIVGRDPIILLALFGFLLLQVPSDRFWVQLFLLPVAVAGVCLLVLILVVAVAAV